jgi:hypothetical protein
MFLRAEKGASARLETEHAAHAAKIEMAPPNE